MRGRRRERLRVESRVHDTNLRSVGEQNRCQVGPTILFECPAQIPRSFLRSFSLWGAPFCGDECRAERALGCGRISPRGQQAGATGEEAAEGRKCDGGAMGTKSTRDVKSVRHSKFCRCSDLGDGER